MTPRELRQTADAARAALAALEADPTAVTAEIDRARRTFRAAHQRWLDASLAALGWDAGDEPAEAAA